MFFFELYVFSEMFVLDQKSQLCRVSQELLQPNTWISFFFSSLLHIVAITTVYCGLKMSGLSYCEKLKQKAKGTHCLLKLLSVCHKYFNVPYTFKDIVNAFC